MFCGKQGLTSIEELATFKLTLTSRLKQANKT